MSQTYCQRDMFWSNRKSREEYEPLKQNIFFEAVMYVFYWLILYSTSVVYSNKSRVLSRITNVEVMVIFYY
jgi:hypothetical protein